LEKRPKNWQKVAKYGKNMPKLGKIGQNYPKIPKNQRSSPVPPHFEETKKHIEKALVDLPTSSQK